jgi:ATP-dependent exoDNAse (exonuclease V) beta subunit
VVHDILQYASSPDDVAALAEIWGRRHAASDVESNAAAEASRRALEYIASIMPAGAERHRELEVMVRLDDGTVVDGRIDFAWCSGNLWTVVDYKTDRREKRNVAQVQLYALALQRATKIPAKGLVLEV